MTTKNTSDWIKLPRFDNFELDQVKWQNTEWVKNPQDQEISKIRRLAINIIDIYKEKKFSINKEEKKAEHISFSEIPESVKAEFLRLNDNKDFLGTSDAEGYISVSFSLGEKTFIYNGGRKYFFVKTKIQNPLDVVKNKSVEVLDSFIEEEIMNKIVSNTIINDQIQKDWDTKEYYRDLCKIKL